LLSADGAPGGVIGAGLDLKVYGEEVQVKEMRGVHIDFLYQFGSAKIQGDELVIPGGSGCGGPEGEGLFIDGLSFEPEGEELTGGSHRGRFKFFRGEEGDLVFGRLGHPVSGSVPEFDIDGFNPCFWGEGPEFRGGVRFRGRPLSFIVTEGHEGVSIELSSIIGCE